MNARAIVLATAVGSVLQVGMGDVPASLLALGSLSSAVTGALGGAVGRLFAGDRLAVHR